MAEPTVETSGQPEGKERFRGRPAHPKSKPRGGYIVHRRGRSRGDLMGRVRPTEHDTLESAEAEAFRLASLHRREFSVFREIASFRFATGTLTLSPDQPAEAES